MTDPLTVAVSDAMLRRAQAAPVLKRWKRDIVEALGVDWRTVEKWLDGETVPSWANGLALCEHLGVDFKNEVEDGSFVSARKADAALVEDAAEVKRLLDLRAGIVRLLKETESPDELERRVHGKLRAVEDGAA